MSGSPEGGSAPAAGAAPPEYLFQEEARGGALRRWASGALVSATMLWPAAGTAQEGDVFRDAGEVNLEAYRWQARPVVVFGAAADAPGYVRQMEALRAAEAGLRDRDVVVLRDAAPGAPSALRGRFAPEGFLVVLIGKDGGVKLSHTAPVSTKILFDTIDAMPMRQREMRRP